MSAPQLFVDIHSWLMWTLQQKFYFCTSFLPGGQRTGQVTKLILALRLEAYHVCLRWVQFVRLPDEIKQSRLNSKTWQESKD